MDTHERARDYLTEAEFLVLLQGTRGSRYRWRNAAMLMLTFYHGLRASELCNLRYRMLIWTMAVCGLPGSKAVSRRNSPYEPMSSGGSSDTSLSGATPRCPGSF